MSRTTSTAGRTNVGRVDDLEPGEKRVVHNGTRDVLLCRAGDGKYYAIGNVCPHQGADLCRGTLTSSTAAQGVGDYAFALDREVLRCARHGWEFNITTGDALFRGTDKRVSTYEVTIEGDEVFVASAATPRRAADAD